MSPGTFWRHIFALMDGLSGATLGLLFYGGWAVFANWPHGQWVALRSGLAQGSMSFVVTLTGVILMRALFRPPGPNWLRAGRAAIGGLGLIYGLILTVHWRLGTPEIFLSLLPGLPITIGFCVFFCASLARFAQAGPAGSP